MGTNRRAIGTGVLFFLFAMGISLAKGLEPRMVSAVDTKQVETLSHYVQGLYFLARLPKPYRYVLSAASLEKAAQLDPSSQTVGELLARCYWSLGQFDRAFTTHQRLVSQHPENWFLLYHQGSLALRVQNYEALQSILARLDAWPPPHPEYQVRFNTASIMWRLALGQKESALEQFKALYFNHQPPHPSPYDFTDILRGYANVLGIQGGVTNLLPFTEFYAAQLASDSERADFYGRIAFMLRGSVDQKSFLHYAEQALRLNPTQLQIVQMIVFPREFREGEDLRLPSRVIAEGIHRYPHPNSVDFSFALTKLFFWIDASASKEALEVYQQVEQLLKEKAGGAIETPLVYSLGASVYLLNEDYARARVLFEKGLVQDPNDLSLLNGLAYTLALMKVELDEALSLIDRVLQEAPTHFAFLDTLSWILYQKGDYEGAYRSLIQAFDYCPKPVGELYDHLGDILVKLGRESEAPTWWLKSYQLDPNPRVGKKLSERGVQLPQSPLNQSKD